jgi:hypothetical protein
MCAGKKTAVGAEGGTATLEKRQGDGDGRVTHKRLKIEENAGMNQTSLSIPPNPFFQPYSEPGFQQPYNNPAGSSEYAPGVPPAPMFGLLQDEPQYYPSSIDPSLLTWLPEQHPHGLSNMAPEQHPNSLPNLLYGEQVAAGGLTEGQNPIGKPEQEVFHVAKQELGESNTLDQVAPPLPAPGLSNIWQNYLNDYDAELEMSRILEAYTNDSPTVEHSNQPIGDQGVSEAPSSGLANADPK